MDITILCSDIDHPVNTRLKRWSELHEASHSISIVRNTESLLGGDILFLISCHDVVSAKIRKLYGASLVIHASELPQGKGWSPHVWQILEGKNNITVSLLEAEDKIDSGAIWKAEKLILEGHELSDEINKKLFKIELSLMDFALENRHSIKPEKQKEYSGQAYPRRTPADSILDPNKTIAEQFDILRVADEERYPAHFSYRGCEYIMSIKKKDSHRE